jgi:hypothetical protein
MTKFTTITTATTPTPQTRTTGQTRSLKMISKEASAIATLGVRLPATRLTTHASELEKHTQLPTRSSEA